MVQRILAGAALLVALTTLTSCGRDHQGLVAPGGEPLFSSGSGECPESSGENQILDCSWATSEFAAAAKSVFNTHWNSTFDDGNGARQECKDAETKLATIFENLLILTFLGEEPPPQPGWARQGAAAYLNLNGQWIPWVGLRDGESSNFLFDGQIENEEYLFWVLLHEGLHLTGDVDHDFLDGMNWGEMIGWCTDSGHPDPVE